MDTNTLVWLATGGTLAGIVCVLIAVVCGLHYGAALRRMPAAAFLEDVVARLAARREELDRFDTQLGERRADLQGRQAEAETLAARRDTLAVQVRELQEDLAGLDGRGADIAQTREDLAELRTQVATANSELEARRAQLARLDREAELADARIAALDARKVEVEAIEEAGQQARVRLVAMQTELTAAAQARDAAQRDEQSALRERDSVQAEIERLAAEQTATLADIAALRIERNPLAAEVESLRRQLEQQNLQREELDDAVRRLQALQPMLEAQVKTLQQDAAAHRSELQSLAEAREPLVAEIDRLRRQVEPLRTQHAALEDDIRRHQALLPMLETKLEALQDAIAAGSTERDNLEAKRVPLAAEIGKCQRQMEILQAHLDAAETELNRRRAEISAMAPGLSPDNPEGGPLADLEQPPACLVGAGGSQPLLPKPQRDDGEARALEQVQAHLAALGLRFPERTLHAFHTALKTATISPLTVLAGISGTGKSQLPRRYAEAMGIHFLKLPVQPRWDSPQDMLGFYNYLEKRYKATEFARALVHFDAHNWPHARPFQDRLLLVLLDEMNLARVEYYFSEFLSLLEGRPAPGDHDAEHIRSSEIVLDAGGTGEAPPRIYPGHNLLFVGTMNEDESTQTLSDKVLDRANLLRFPRPDRLIGEALASGGEPADGYLPASRWHAWRHRFSELPRAVQQPVEGWIHDLNEHLDGLHRPFAHRVNQAMLAYIANYPGVAVAGSGDALARARIAFADQLEQRILPKLRGVDLGDPVVARNLDRIGQLITGELRDETLFTAFHQAALDDGSGRPFLWTGVRRESA